LETAGHLSGWEIFVAEQSSDSRPFNRGQLLNAGALQAMREGYDSLCFHDVDLVLGDLETVQKMVAASTLAESTWRESQAVDWTAACGMLYALSPRPRPIHIGWSWSKYKYDDYCGGILTVDAHQFRSCQGFPNTLWGWGGEDDVLATRLRSVVKPRPKSEFVVDKASAVTMHDYVERTVLRAGLMDLGQYFEWIGLETVTKRDLNSKKKKVVWEARSNPMGDGLRTCGASILRSRQLSPRVCIMTYHLQGPSCA